MGTTNEIRRTIFDKSVPEILWPYRLIRKADEARAEDALYEGLITTYSIEKTIETIHNALKCRVRKYAKILTLIIIVLALAVKLLHLILLNY